MINVICTSKPSDGLLHYSYEHACALNGRLVIVCSPGFTPQDYIDTIHHSYIHCNNVVFDDFEPEWDDVTLIMGRSMMTLPYLNWDEYSHVQKFTLHYVFEGKVIAVYSENHPKDYPRALKFFRPQTVYDLCDKEVYPNGEGDHFEKTIHFEYYKPPVKDIQFKHLFMGTNRQYYEAVKKVIHLYPDHGIITYEGEPYLDPNLNNIYAPVENLLGKFEVYVYTKDTFDPAPRIIQECKYFGMPYVYQRKLDYPDGGSVYHNRDIVPPDLRVIYEKSQ